MKDLLGYIRESLLDVDSDTDFDEKMIITQFFDSVESQQQVIKYLQGLIEDSGEPSITFTVVKNDLWSNNMYVVFPKKQTLNGYRIIIVKRGKHGFQMWSAYADAILDQTMVSAGEAKYICGAKSNLIYKVPSSMYKIFDTIVHKRVNDKLGIKESLLDDDDEIMSKVESKYNFTNLITNLAFTYSYVAKYEELCNMIAKVLSEYKVKPRDLENPKDGEVFFLRFNRLIWSDGQGGRVGVPGSKPFNCGIMISGKEMKFRVSRPRNTTPFQTGYIFDKNDAEHKGFIDALEQTKSVEIYRVPEENRKDIVIALTFGKWPKYEKL